MEEIHLNRKDLQSLAGQVISLSISSEKREEDLWLCDRYQDFLRKSGAKSREEGDLLLSQKMTEIAGAAMSDSPSAGLKIRYWRTGRHYPKNRAICVTFGQALGLDTHEQYVLMTCWFNRSDRCFCPKDLADPVYQYRIGILTKLKQEFLEKQRPEELLAMCAPGTAPEENLRYIYCNQVYRFLGNSVRRNTIEPISHLDTRGYEYQFNREMKLIGEISRSAMIRHLLILGLPFVSRERMNGWLTALGYAPLTKDHRLPGGAAADLMILGILEGYEKECTGRDPAWCMEWFRQTAGMLDDALEAVGCTAANPFRFKHIMGGKDV